MEKAKAIPGTFLTVGTRVKWTVPGWAADGTVTWIAPDGAEIEILWDDDIYHQTYSFPNPRIDIVTL